MDRLIIKTSNIWVNVRKPLLLLFFIIISIFFSIYILSIPRIAGDAASHLLLAVSPILKIGSPYRDIWEIKPPVWPLVMYLWSSVFGFGILSLKIANIAFGIGVLFISRKIYKTVFQTPVFEIIFIFSMVVVLSPIFHTFLIPTEILGLFLSIAALLIIIKTNNEFNKFYFSGLLFFAASQTKEPYSFTMLAVLPFLFESLLSGGILKLIRNILQLLMGVFTGFIIIYFYLICFGSVDAYIEIFKYKEVVYKFTLEKLFLSSLTGFQVIERTYSEFSSGFFIVIIMVVFSFLLINIYKKTIRLNSKRTRLIFKPIDIVKHNKIQKCSVLFYSIGSILGFGIGGSFGSHYLIQVAIPYYFIGGLMISYLFDNVSTSFGKSKLRFLTTLIIFIISLIVITPKRQYFSSYIQEKYTLYLSDTVNSYVRRVSDLTIKDQCILNVYGWGSSEDYFYSKRKPCTRFFLPNIVTQAWQKSEYAKAIKDNPPSVIIYRVAGADMDVPKFESEVINIKKIIENCYIQDYIESSIYIRKTNNFEILKKCIIDSSV